MQELQILYEDLGLASVNWELVVRGVLQVVLLTASAIFSGSETALFSLSRIDLQKLRNTRNPYSESIHALLDEPRRLIISILCGNELVNIASAGNMTAILVMFFSEEEAGWVNIVIMVPLLLLVGEVTPKTIAVNFPIKYSTRISARLLPRWIIFITPLRGAVRLIADRITTFVVGEAVDRQNILQSDELRTLLEEGEETGIIDATERVLIDNLLEASETEIYHIMTPGPRICFLDASLPVPELVAQFRELRHPRIPVYSGHWDNVIGFLHSEVLLRLIRGGADLSQVHLEDILKPAHFVPPTKKVDEMFDYFQANRTRAAIVLGEYGEVLGIVTMKDVITFIFGEISGRMKGQELYHEEDENCYTVPGDMRLTDFYNLTNFGIEDPMMTTIGGVAFRLFDRLPQVGDKVLYEGYEITVKALSGLRISSVQVRKGTTLGPAPASAEEAVREQSEYPADMEIEPGAEEQEQRPPETQGQSEPAASDAAADKKEDL